MSPCLKKKQIVLEKMPITVNVTGNIKLVCAYAIHYSLRSSM